MVFNASKARRPVVFGRKKAPKSISDNSVPQDDDTLDMLLHYAIAGMENAEESLLRNPEKFTPEEKRMFELNKTMLDQAPFLIETYKSKVSEYDALHKKMLSILSKCEEIVAAGDDQAKNEIKKVITDSRVFTYADSGELIARQQA